jgi:hypothetical protein
MKIPLQSENRTPCPHEETETQQYSQNPSAELEANLNQFRNPVFSRKRYKHGNGLQDRSGARKMEDGKKMAMVMP